MLNRLDRYILREIAVPAVVAFCIVAFLAVVNEFRTNMERLPAGLLTAGDLARLGVLLSPSLISYIVPITYFLGIMFAFGRLSEHGEITAIRAGGISLRRIISPVILMGAILSAMCYLVQDVVQPWALRRAYDLMYTELPERLTVDTLAPGVMHEYEGWHIYFRDREPGSGAMRNIDIVFPDRDGQVWVFHAQSGELSRDGRLHRLTLRQAHIVTPDNMQSDSESWTLTLPSPSAEKGGGSSRSLQNLQGLLDREAESAMSYAATGSERAQSYLYRDRREISDRLSLPFAALALSIAGAPIGVRAGHGGRGARARTFASASIILLCYYVLRIVVEPESLAGLPSFVARAWIPNAVLITAGAALVWRVDRT